MPAPTPHAENLPAPPGGARIGLRQRVAALAPAVVTLPLRARIGNTREPEIGALSRFVSAGDTVVDIGAHKGIYTYWLGRLVGPGGRVLAYEPQPALHSYLRKGMPRRFYPNVELSDVALSDHIGAERLTIPVLQGESQIAWASLEQSSGSDAGAQPGEQVQVRTTTLDAEVGSRSITLVKCDVEGHELKVLLGSSQLIARQRPVWLLELEQRHAAGAVAVALQLLADAGYEPWWLTAMGQLASVPVHQRRPDILNNVEPGRYVNNFFFLPRVDA